MDTPAFPRPILFATLGFPGSGKTYFSSRFSRDIGAFHLNSDRLRSEMFHTPKFTGWENQSVFKVMDYITAELLEHQMSVAYDGNSNKQVFRKRLEQIAQERGADYWLLYFQTPLETALERIQGRADQVEGDDKKYYKNIDPAVLHRIKNNTEPPDNTEPVIALDGTDDYHSLRDQVMKIVLI